MSRLRKDQTVHSATLADVGRAAGVSAMAASAVLNPTRKTLPVSPATRDRIIAVAAELNYRPNVVARALSNRRMNALGVVAAAEDGKLDDYFLGIFNGIHAAATRHRQNTTVFTLHDWRLGLANLNNFCDGRIDGLILLSPNFGGDSIRLPESVPFVSIQGERLASAMATIDCDEEGGACTLVRRLLALGHRRIMHLTGPVGQIGTERLVRGYQCALDEAGIPFDPQLVVPAGSSSRVGMEAMRSWMQRHAGESLPHAVFCANDATAVGCLEVFAKIGLHVPDDISVAGFGDTYAARSIAPQLTSVSEPLAEMGAEAVEELLRCIDRSDRSSECNRPSVVFPISLAQRASVGPRAKVERVIDAWRTEQGES